ncbi:MAG: phospholipid carrier-dependent glycosyltransferase [Pseudomonadota bacterium]
MTDSMKQILVALGLILVFFGVYLMPLGVRPLMIPDETRYAEVPREMIETGDWVVPRLNGLRYFEKPVMGYWLNGLSILAFGENAFAVRFPSAAAAGLSALMVFFLASRSLGRLQGLMAAGVLLTAVEVFGIGTFAVLDSMLSFFLTASLGFFYLAWESRHVRVRRIAFLILSGLFCGLACHTKGFLAFAVPVVVTVPFLVWQGQWKEVFRFAWIPLVTALLVMVPWGVMVHLREPQFWDFFFWNEHVHRFFAADNAQHKEPFYYFLMVLPLGLVPWIALAPAAARGLVKTGLKNPFLRYALCWTLFPLVFFSVSSGKIATYILPCFPAMAALVAQGLYAYGDGAQRFRLWDVGALALAGFFCIVALAMGVVQAGMVKGFTVYASFWKGSCFIFGLISFSAFLVLSARAREMIPKWLFFGLSPVVLLVLLPFLMPDLTILRKAPGILFTENRDLVTRDTVIVSQASLIRAVCWTYKRRDVFQLEEGGELSYGLNHADSAHRLLDFEQFTRLVDANRGKRRVLLVVDPSKLDLWKSLIPQPEFLRSSGEKGFVLVFY